MHLPRHARRLMSVISSLSLTVLGFIHPIRAIFPILWGYLQLLFIGQWFRFYPWCHFHWPLSPWLSQRPISERPIGKKAELDLGELSLALAVQMEHDRHVGTRLHENTAVLRGCHPEFTAQEHYWDAWHYRKKHNNQNGCFNHTGLISFQPVAFMKKLV